MKRILTTLLLIASVAFFMGCDSSDSVTEADAATKAATGEINGKVMTVLQAAGAQIQPETGSSRATTISSTAITAHPGATVSGTLTQNGSNITADLVLKFTNCVVDGTTLNGTITYHAEISGTSTALVMTGDVTAVHSGSSYKLDYKLTMNINDGTVSYTGYINANGDRVNFSGTGVA